MDMKQYYDHRAKEYEAVYERGDGDRKQELEQVVREMRSVLAGSCVLEVACGTGFWTQKIADVAERIVAIDAAKAMLAVASSKHFPTNKVTFRLGDAYELSKEGGPFDGGLAMFWVSHIPRADVEKFLTRFHAVLEPGSRVFIADNEFRDDAGGEFARKPGSEDTFRIRTLADGSKHEIIKNYFDEDQLRKIFSPFAEDLDIKISAYFWRLHYTIPSI